MKQNTNLKSLLVAVAALGLVATASAQSTSVAVPTPSETQSASGLLGTRYTAVEANYYDLLGGSPGVARGLTLSYNQPLNPYLDLGADYSWAEAHLSGVRITQQQFDVGATAYTKLAWGKPFAMADAGWVWARTANGFEDDSFAYKLGVGVEFQALRNLTVTPYFTFVRTTHFNTSEFDGGVKAAYRLTRDWSVTARVGYDWIRHSDDTLEYALGMNYSF